MLGARSGQSGGGGSQPSEETLNLPAPFVAAQRAAILRLEFLSAAAVRRDPRRSSKRTILEAVPDFHEPTFFLSGPSGMVAAHEQLLHGLGVARARIKRDSFPGLV